MMDIINAPTVLVVDDEKNIRTSIEIALGNEGISVLKAADALQAIDFMKTHIVDLILMDIRMGEIDGLTAFKKIQQFGFSTPCIFMSGQASLTEAATSVRLGAFDFLEKPFSAERLVTTVRRALEYAQLTEKVKKYESNNEEHQLIGEGLKINQVRTEAAKVAKANVNIVIQGESGTGKELLCEYIHAHSERASGPLVKINCSAIPETLLESELFGYEKGAFTGASGVKRGYFEIAHRGTIFLDEIGDLSLVGQAKVLRVLQSGEIQKLGSEKNIRVDVRVIAATHKNLKQMVAEGTFREDLFYRLNVVPLVMPSLRDRREDIPILFNHFLQTLSKKHGIKPKNIDPEVYEDLASYAWPGNIRELINVLERVLILSGNQIGIDDFPEELMSVHEREASVGLSLKSFRDNSEREYIIQVIKKNGGNVSQSAKEMGIGRTYLHKRLLQFGIGKNELFE